MLRCLEGMTHFWVGMLQAERARRIEEKKERRRYERQMQRRQEYVARCRDELEERRRKVNLELCLQPASE